MGEQEGREGVARARRPRTDSSSSITESGCSRAAIERTYANLRRANETSRTRVSDRRGSSDPSSLGASATGNAVLYLARRVRGGR